MQILKLFILLGLSVQSVANSLLPPEQIIEKAKKSRSDFVEVIGDVQRFASSLSSKEELFPYIRILDELKKIEDANGVGSIGENLSQSVGYVLTRNGIKWLRLDLDSPEFIEIYFRWSENATRYQIAGVHLKLMVLVADKGALIHWFERASLALDYIQGLKSEAYVIEGFEQLQASSVQRLMKIRGELQPDQIIKLLEKTKSLLAIQSVLAFLNEEGLKTDNLDDLETYLRWVCILGGNLQAINQAIPFYVLSAPGQLIVTLITKFLTMNRTFDLTLVSPLIENLLPSQVPSLGASLIYLFKDKIIPEEVLDTLVELSTKLYERYLKLNLGNATKEMARFLSQVTLLQAGLTNQIEGSYKVTVRDKPGLLNLVHLGNGKFFMGLSVRYGGEVSVDFSFFYITYNKKDEMWNAVHYNPDDPNSPNQANEVFYSTFKLTPEVGRNKIEGILYTAKLTSPFQGRQTNNFLNFGSDPREIISNVSGVFTGEVRGYQFRMLVYQMEQRLQGVMLVTGPSSRIPVNVDLEYGYYDPRKNVAYLTSGRFDSFRWVHIRGEFLDGGRVFQGQYIQSVYGPIHQLRLNRDEGVSRVQ